MFARTLDSHDLTTKNTLPSSFRSHSAARCSRTLADPKERETFRTVYCRSINVPEREFEQYILREAVYTHLRPLVMILGRSADRLFRQDVELIRVLGETQSPIQFVHELNSFRYQNSFLREKCRIRVSGRRLLRVLISIWEKP